MTIKLDFDDARYSVKDYKGVAFYLHSWPQKWIPEQFAVYNCEHMSEEDYGVCDWCIENNVEIEPMWVDSDFEGEWQDDTESGVILAVMVGDDKKHTVDISDLTILEEDVYCHSCGQIGCTADRLE